MKTSHHDRSVVKPLLSLPLAALLVLSVVPGALGAGATTSAWQAKVGTSGANGSANVATVSTGAGSIGLKLVKLRPSSLLPVAVYKGTCSSVGALLFKLASIKATSTGAAARTSSLTTAQVNLITSATKGTGKIAIRVGSGSSAKCGAFARRSVLGPQAVVQAFYDWYLTDGYYAHLVGRPDITPTFVRWLINGDRGYDAVTCAQDTTPSVLAGPATIAGSSATVTITEGFYGSPTQPVELALGPTGWQISAVNCVF